MKGHQLMSALDSCPEGNRTTIQSLPLMEIKIPFLDMPCLCVGTLVCSCETVIEESILNTRL